ncbi:MAG: 1-(5-phosphoribosyl)-5-amino-4-imidazole-carboxylate carboxylase, partial [Patescibacteria group bacterium]|nr:1-(5-phosphoribosyl)-5-amino-4-imidazole-carboxylate carboxylase [Patescibacteria group bacterium]
MDQNTLRNMAQSLLAGELSAESFLRQVAPAGIGDTGDAQVDLDRSRRCGFPEVVYGEGKTVEAIERIFQTSLEHGSDVFATRISAEKAQRLIAAFPTGRYNGVARTFRIPIDGLKRVGGKVSLVTAGTSDLPVAEEALETLLWTGAEVRMVQDVGVAGP